jgi:hypothetical protein
MSRLFYEDDEQQPSGSMLEGGPARGPVLEGSPAGGRKPRRTKAQSYMEKVGKLIPAEVVAAYEMLSGFVPGINPESWHAGFYWLAFAIGLVCTPVYMFWQSERGRAESLAHCAIYRFVRGVGLCAFRNASTTGQPLSGIASRVRPCRVQPADWLQGTKKVNQAHFNEISRCLSRTIRCAGSNI